MLMMTESDETTCQGEDRRGRKMVRLGQTEIVKRGVAMKRAREMKDAGVKTFRGRAGTKSRHPTIWKDGE